MTARPVRDLFPAARLVRYLSPHRLAAVSDRLRKWLPLAALLLLYLAVGSAKLILTQASPFYDPRDETNLHFTENAVQYRYAKMIAEGVGVPEVDTRLQHPEGVRVAEELTITLERVSGNLYRFLAWFGYDAPFHAYSVWFIAFFSSLAVFPLYWGASRLWGGWLPGLLAVAFYAVMPPAWMRSITSFSREDFTLVFLFTGLVAFGLSQSKGRERWMPWLAGAALSVAAISWHITGFVVAILIGYAVVAWVACPDERDAIHDAIWPIILLLFLTGLASDLLRNKWFVASTTMLVGYGLLAAHAVGRRFRLSTAPRVAVLLGVPVALHFLLSSLVGENVRAYSHALEVLWYKIRFGLVKPADPTLMTYDARGMWSSSFRSPTPGSVWSMFSTLLVVSGASAALAVREWVGGTLPRGQRFFTYCFFAFLAGYVAFDRIQVFLVFFAALLAVRWLVVFPTRRTAVAAVLVAFIGYEIYNDTRLYITVHRAPGLDRLVTWVRENTAQDDVVLAAFHIGPSILAYTGRPIVTHPKFESHVIREKTERFLDGLFSPEPDFYALARSWEADWYVYQASMGLDTTTESPRYVAGRTSIPTDSALYAFHFAPERLTRFHLVYQDPTYRIYKVGDPPATRPAIAYQPVFDPGVFGVRAGQMPSDAQIERVSRELGDPMVRARLAEALYADGRYGEAADEYARLVERRPDDANLRLGLGNALDRAGRTREAAPHYLRALSLNPSLPRHRFETTNGAVFRDGARLLLQSGRKEAGVRWLEMAVTLAPDDVEAATNLGILYGQDGRDAEARALFERVAAAGTEYPNVHLQLGLLDQREGHHGRAIEHFRRYLSLDPASPNRAAVREAIRASQSALGG